MWHLFDLRLIEIIGNLRNPFLSSLMILITSLGSTKIIILLLVIFSVGFIFYKKYYYILVLSSSFAGGEALVWILKHGIARIRPEILFHLIKADGFSFPSGHSFTSFMFYGLLAYFFTREIKNKIIQKIIWLVTSVLIFSIGFSRIYLGVHWPTDVLGGFVLAYFWLILIIFIFKKKMLL